MNAQPTRRAILSAVAVVPLAGVTNTPALALLDAGADLSAIAAQLATAAEARRLALHAARSARRMVVRWRDKNEQPAAPSDLLAWVARYRSAILASGALEKQTLHNAACAAHSALAVRTVAVAPRATLAELRALAQLLPFDCDGIIRAAVLAGVQGEP